MIEHVFDDGAASDEAVLARLHSLTEEVRTLPCAGSDAARIDQLSALEDLKRAVCAAQARVTDAFARSQRAAQIEAGVPSDRASRGVADQVARARREAPSRGDTHVGLARALVREMPCTLVALTTGRIDEWTATGLVRETAVLTLEHRTQVDAELAGMLAEEGRSHGELVRAAKGAAQRLDAAAAARRAATAASDRRVSIRPAPDTMVWVGALLPVVDGVATYASLDRDAASAKASGDPRGRGQLMADLLVQRVTGRDLRTTPADVRIELVMADTALLGDPDDPGRGERASVRARGLAPMPIPAPVARDLVARAGASGRAWLRRLYQAPRRDRLVAMDSRSRLFPTGLAELIALDDQTCRAPWCDAPICASDHVRPVAADGATSRENGQGLCQRCNLAKEAPGWRSTRAPDGAVTSTAPTGHSTTTRPPPPLSRPARAVDDGGRVDIVLAVPRHRRAA